MQPLISVEHESRHNSYRAEDEQLPSENTPLLSGHFPTPGSSDDRNTFTTVVVTVLLIILLSGIIIGIYLLIEQNREENVLPPVEMALQLVSNGQWDRSPRAQLLTRAPFKAKHVLVTQTDTEQCWGTRPCVELLRDLQTRVEGGILLHNFLISSNGQTFESLGWRRPSPLYPQYADSALVIGFIGNFTEQMPTRTQVEEAQRLFDESVSQQYLDPSFTLIGKSSKNSPKYLFQSLQRLKQWSHDLSDT